MPISQDYRQYPPPALPDEGCFWEALFPGKLAAKLPQEMEKNNDFGSGKRTIGDQEWNAAHRLLLDLKSAPLSIWSILHKSTKTLRSLLCSLRIVMMDFATWWCISDAASWHPPACHHPLMCTHHLGQVLPQAWCRVTPMSFLTPQMSPTCFAGAAPNLRQLVKVLFWILGDFRWWPPSFKLPAGMEASIGRKIAIAAAGSLHSPFEEGL